MSQSVRTSLDRSLWAAQWILACAFDLIGMVKLGLRVDDARQIFGLGAGVTTETLHLVGALEVAMAAALILPGVTRILPRSCPVAAAALGAVAVYGMVQPAGAAGAGITGVNLALAALACFVVGGRLTAPIEIPSIPAEASHG